MPLDDLTDDDIRRIRSWLQEARRLSDDDFFKKMIFYWISFNCYYGAKYEFKDRPSSEKEKIKNVFTQLSLIRDDWCQSFIERNIDNIIALDDHMNRDQYRAQFGEFYNQFFNDSFRDAFVELLFLLNLVRNRLFHGGKNYNNPDYGNREVLLNCCNILEQLMLELNF